MKVQVTREACCAQDDQMGPLEAVYELQADARFGELVATIQASRFLQYSSSHTALQGEAGGAPVVRLFSPFHTHDRPAEFVAGAEQPVHSVIGDEPLRFRFVVG